MLARRASRGEIGRLRVGYAYWVDLASLQAIVRLLDQRHPAIRVELRGMSVPAQIAALREQSLDVGFMRPPVNETSLSSEVVLDEPLVVALPRSHPRAAGGSLPLSALADEPFLLHPHGTMPLYHDFIIEHCRAAGFVPHVRHEVDEPQMLLGLVAAGVGIALVPASTARRRPPGVSFRSLRDSSPSLQTALVWRRGDASPALDFFRRLVHEVMVAGRGRRP